MSEVETRTLHRALAALPDAVAAAYLVHAWWFPLQAGRDGVFSSIALMAMELPALLGLAALFMLHSSSGSIDRIKAGVCVCVSVGAVISFAASCYSILPSHTLVVATAALLWGKWLVFSATKRNSTWFVEAMRLSAHLMLLMLVFTLAPGMEIPRGGFDDSTLGRLQLPGSPFGEDTRPSPWRHPWWGLAAGSFY